MKLIKHTISQDIPDYLSHLSVLSANLIAKLVKNEAELSDLMECRIKQSAASCYQQAVAFLLRIQSQQEKVIICGDYDCDGITSTTMLCMICKKMGIDYGYYIPNRLKEGYGTSPNTIISAYEKGYQNVIMVDNGVKAVNAIKQAKQFAMALMVIDHHQLDQTYEWDVLVHDSLLEPYFQGQSAAGLVFGLAQTLDLVDENMLVLAGVGLIGDMMVVKGQTRAIISESLNLLNQGVFLPIQVLLKRKQEWDLTVVSFHIVPILNAVGRLADRANVNQVVQFLLSEDPVVIQGFAKQLIELNDTRKALSKNQLAIAKTLTGDDGIQIIYSPQFHEGIIGIIAGQIANQTNQPTIVLAKSNQVLKASVRSSGGLNIFELLLPFSDFYFREFGGHEAACAFSMEESKLEPFKQALSQKMKMVQLPEPSFEVLCVGKEDLTLEAVYELKLFEPLGKGFSLMPLYLTALVIRVSRLGHAGYRLTVFNCGEVKELLVFKNDIVFNEQNFTIQVIGHLSVNYKNELVFIVSDIVA